MTARITDAVFENVRNGTSSAIITPEAVLPSACLFRIGGTEKSYSCQMALLDMNARPTRQVRLALSFVGSLLCVIRHALCVLFADEEHNVVAPGG